MSDVTLNDFKSWVDDIGKHANSEDVEIVTDTHDTFKIRIYTDNNSYSIVATGYGTDRVTGGYLGCVASSRKPRAGEDWTRGSDLADGDLSKETWYKILGDIVAYELVKVHKP